MAEFYTQWSKIDDGTVFIMAKNTPSHFLHYIGKNPNGDAVYELRKGIVGAALWKKFQAESFIKISGVANLEVVPAVKILNI